MKESDSSNFLQILSKHGILTPLTHDPYSFVITRPSGQNNRFDHIVGAIINTFRNEGDSTKIRPVDGFVYGTIEQILPSCQLARFTVEDASNAKIETLLFSSLSIPIEAYPTLFSRILNINNLDEKISDLMKLKKQWELTSYAEWDHHSALRAFVHDVEEWIDENCQMSELHCRLLFNLSITLFTDFFGNLQFSEQLMYLISVMMSAFISDNSKDGCFIANDGTGLTFEEAENNIYWNLKAALLKISKNKMSSLQESLSIRTALSAISSSTLEMLNDHGFTSLDFTFIEAEVFFGYNKKRSEKLLLLVSALASNDINGFRKNGIIASLILLQETLQIIKDNDSFIHKFSIEIRKLDSRLLLYNIERLFASERLI
ncbi:hypothetical protein TRFO_16041 [Tritrichomonas foetus]|uniref:Uncharacterized protein n=1 Tax=Tritrichomonas foetus TaxID=1144522 RepID=A0A1J4KR08_9EUKA|nr:hypothetical protein TRFO_16041 [Tritrichomonas foetus]|eukprot:OHT13721.1 hypothetical protein TRFO_16041 [Tritrichomonas foetus]